MNKIKNIFFCNGFYSCGGIEAFHYYMAKQFHNNPNFEIEIWYRGGDQAQINLVSKYAKCVKWDGQSIIKCDNFFYPSRDIGKIIGKVEAKNIISVFHMAQDLKWNTNVHPFITKYIAVSKAGAEVWNKAKPGSNCTCYYPIICVDKYEKPEKLNDGILRLVSVSRLDTPDKGAARMKKIADRLDELNVKWEWDIYGINNKILTNSGFKYHGVVLDKDTLFKEELKHDFLVQLSDAEGFCITIGEALSLNIPIVITPISVAPELKLTENNSIICNFDCSNIDEVINKMTGNNKFEFTYEMPIDGSWEELLSC